MRSGETYWFCRTCRREFSDRWVENIRFSSTRSFQSLKQTPPKNQLSPFPFHQQSSEVKLNQPLLCIYDNLANSPKVVRIENVKGYYFERTVSPKQRLIFETVVGAQLKVMGSEACHLVHEDTIPCESLAVHSLKAERLVRAESLSPLAPE